VHLVVYMYAVRGLTDRADAQPVHLRGRPTARADPARICCTRPTSAPRPCCVAGCPVHVELPVASRRSWKAGLFRLGWR